MDQIDQIQSDMAINYRIAREAPPPQQPIPVSQSSNGSGQNAQIAATTMAPGESKMEKAKQLGKKGLDTMEKEGKVAFDKFKTVSSEIAEETNLPTWAVMGIGVITSLVVL